MERGDRFLEAVAPDEPHRIVGAAVAIRTQSINGDDPRMFQAAGDLRLEQEALATDRVVGMMVEYLLQRDLAVQLRIEGNEDRPQTASSVRPQDAESLAVAGRLA